MYGSAKVYLPSTYACADYMGNGIIRVYTQRPSRPSSSSSGYYSFTYYDIYINDNYLYRQGTSNFYYNTTLPSCGLNNNISTNWIYRQDIDKIMITLFVLIILLFYFPYRIFSRILGRWAKL